jgi:hypothetical protein
MKIRIDIPITTKEAKKIDAFLDETGRKRNSYTKVLLLEAVDRHEAEKKARAISQKAPQ